MGFSTYRLNFVLRADVDPIRLDVAPCTVKLNLASKEYTLIKISIEPDCPVIKILSYCWLSVSSHPFIANVESIDYWKDYKKSQFRRLTSSWLRTKHAATSSLFQWVISIERCCCCFSFILQNNERNNWRRCFSHTRISRSVGICK